MGKRRGTKIKAVAAPTEDALAAALGLTVERWRRDEWTQGAAIAMHGEKANVRENMPRRVSRVKQMQRDRWVDEDGASILTAYEDFVHLANYDHARSCLDRTPVGHGEGGTPPAVAYARDQLAKARNVVCTHPRGMEAMMVAHELLFSLDNVEDTLARIMRGGRDSRRTRARILVEIAVTGLGDLFGQWKKAA